MSDIEDRARERLTVSRIGKSAYREADKDLSVIAELLGELERARVNVADAQKNLEHAQTNLAKVRNVIRQVRELHPPREGEGVCDEEVCHTCGSGRWHVEQVCDLCTHEQWGADIVVIWPCPTIRILDEAERGEGS